MNPDQESFSGANNSRNLVILTVILVVILVIVFTLLVLFKPDNKEFSTVKGEISDTPKEHIERIEAPILKIYNLTEEVRMFDELFDELIYTESPRPDRIGDFVSNYKNFAASYAEDKNNLLPSDWYSMDYDSSIINFDRQQKYLEKSIVSLLNSIDKKRKFLMTVPVAFPIAKEDAQIISGFGMRDHPILNEPRLHTGIDIKASVGTAVLATASGKIIMTDEQIGSGYGQPCLIEHKFGYSTLYGHMVRLEVHKGKLVRKGDVIGRVGDTGLSQGPHLHYEVRKNGKPLNPSYFIFEGLTEKEYKEVVALGTH